MPTEDPLFNLTKYKTAQEILDFFYDFGISDSCMTETRAKYTKSILKSLNGTEKIKLILEEVVYPNHDNTENSIINVVEVLNRSLKKDGYEFTREGVSSSELQRGKLYRIKPVSKNTSFVETKEINALSHEFIDQQIDKAKKKFDDGDYSGVITNIRSMIEAVQENLIVNSGMELPEYKGSVKLLYNTTKQSLNLSKVGLDSYLQQILIGLDSINLGIAGLSNNASNRHSIKYKPAKHHAKLVIDSGLSFCEFLLGSYEYQKTKNAK